MMLPYIPDIESPWIAPDTNQATMMVLTGNLYLSRPALHIPRDFGFAVKDTEATMETHISGKEIDIFSLPPSSLSNN